MALATRNLYLVLKARDEASRVIKGFGRELAVTGKLAQAQTLRNTAAIADQRIVALQAAAQMAGAEARQMQMAKQREIQAIRTKAMIASQNAATIVGSSREVQRQRELAQQLRRTAATKSAELAEMRAGHKAESDAIQTEIEQERSLARTARASAAQLERQHGNTIRLANALHQVSSTLITVGSGFAIAGAAGLFGLYEAAKAAAEYQRQVALTATQVDGFKVSLQQLSDVGLKTARTIAVPFEEIQPALYDIFSSTSANLEQAQILLEGFAKTAVAGQVSLQDATRGTIPILNAFNLPLESVNRILDIQFQLVRKGVGTYGEFASVFGRVVPSATRAGQSFEEVAAMLAYLTRNGLSAAMASTSAARALDAMSNPKAVHSMENLGIKVRDAAGNMLPLETSLKNLQKYLLGLPNKDRISALVDIFKGAGGTIQARRFLDQILLKPGELDEFVGFLNDMKNSSGQFEMAYDKMSNTVAAQTTLLRNKFKVMEVTIGQAVTPIFVAILKVLNRIVDAFNNLSPATQKWIGIGIALASVFLIIAGVTLITVGALAGIAAAIMTAGAGFFYLVGAVIGVVAALASFGAIIAIAWTRSKRFREILQDIHDTGMHLWKDVLVPFALDVKKSFEMHLLPSLLKLKDLIEKYVLPAVLSLQRTFGGSFLADAKEVANFMKDRLGQVFGYIGWVITTLVIPAVKWLTQFYQKHKETIDEIVQALGEAAKWFLIVAGIITGVLLMAFVGTIVVAIVVFIAAILAIIAVIIGIINAVKNVIHWFGDFGAHLDWLGTKMADFVVGIVNWFRGLGKNIMDSLHDFDTLLIQSGKNLMKGLIQGITDSIPGLGSVLHGVAAFIKDHFPSSPAKRGPLSGKGSLFYSGQKLMEQLSSGIASQQVALGTASSGAALNAAGSQLTSPSARHGGNVQQTFNITTQEINPRKHSQELGFLLASRV
jgi:TP901 family phage tail tape measure protein